MASKRVLIIEDDIELSEQLAEALQDESYFTDCCSDPVKGEGLIRNGDYEIILLDYKLPGLTGIDILKKLKADNIKKRIFLVTGRPSVERVIKEEYLSDMIGGIISKPIDFEGLLKKIKVSPGR